MTYNTHELAAVRGAVGGGVVFSLLSALLAGCIPAESSLINIQENFLIAAQAEKGIVGLYGKPTSLAAILGYKNTQNPVFQEIIRKGTTCLPQSVIMGFSPENSLENQEQPSIRGLCTVAIGQEDGRVKIVAFGFNEEGQWEQLLFQSNKIDQQGNDNQEDFQEILTTDVLILEERNGEGTVTIPSLVTRKGDQVTAGFEARLVGNQVELSQQPSDRLISLNLATETPTSKLTPTLELKSTSPTVTPTLSSEEQRTMALQQALGENYALFAEKGWLTYVDVERGEVRFPAIAQEGVEHVIKLENLQVEKNNPWLKAAGLEGLLIKNQETNSGYLWFENVNLSGWLKTDKDGNIRYYQGTNRPMVKRVDTGFLEVSLPEGEAQEALTAEDWLKKFAEARPVGYEGIPQDPDSPEAMAFYLTNLRHNIEALLALPAPQLFEMKVKLGGVNAGELAQWQRDLGLTDNQVWEIAKKLTGKKITELMDLAFKIDGMVFYDVNTGEAYPGLARPAEVLEFLTRLDGSLQYRWFSENLEGDLRNALADEYHKKTPEEIEAEVSRIRNQVFGAFTDEELRDLAGKLAMPEAESASEAEILAWLEENYHWLTTTNPFESQILTKAYGFMDLRVDVLGFGSEVRRLDVEAPDGEVKSHYVFPAFVANVGPEGRTIMPVMVGLQPVMLEDEGVMRRFFDEVYSHPNQYNISLILAFDRSNYSYGGYPVATIPTDSNNSYQDVFNLDVLDYYEDSQGNVQVIPLLNLILSGANAAAERIGDVRVIDERNSNKGLDGYARNSGYSSIVTGYWYDDLFPLDWSDFMAGVYPIRVVKP